jgi:O-antigen ligase
MFLPLQPGAVDMRQIVNFLNYGDRSDWRYLTFGFGDQLALLSTLTTATTIDGSYHTARTLPELRSSGIGQIDTAFWFPDGLSKLDPILQKAGEHGVRWGFVNVAKYVPVLERNGWTRLRTLQSGVQIWENPDAKLPQPSQPPQSALASFSWGTLPILSLVTALSLGSLRLWPAKAEEALRTAYYFVAALIPLGLCFWYYRTIGYFPHDRVYFIYTDALFFLGDALVLLSVVLWLSTRIAQTAHLQFNSSLLLPSAFCILLFFSILWSKDWRTALYISVHVVVLFLYFFSLCDWPYAWKFILLGFCAALSIQIIAGMVGFMSQSTAFLAPLHLNWPGSLDPSVRGAIVVELPNGESFLRAYGTLPHPNILGGFALILLLGPVSFFLRKERPNNLALLLLIPGVSLLALSFSHSAWLALLVLCTILVWKSIHFDRRRLAILLLTIALSFVITLFPYRELVQARTLNTTSHSEEFSFIGRAWLNGEARRVITEVPLTGVGIGSFIIELAKRAGEGYVIEPAHNLFLLAGAELGIPGLLLVVAMFISLAHCLIKTRSPNAILAGATLAGLGLISLFDHYLWTLAPGRLMLGLVIGMFVGQDFRHAA